MKVAISVGGRFHAFDMAAQLERRGWLRKLITSYPKSKVRQWDIPSGSIATVLSHEIVSRGYRHLAARMGLRHDPQFSFNDRYDRLAARRLPADTEIAVAWSGMGLHTLRQAARLGAVTVLERNSSHILFQKEMLSEEYARFGLTPQLPDPRMVDRELQEYDEAGFVCLPSTFALNTFLAKGVRRDKLLMVPFGVAIGQFPAAEPNPVFRIVHCGSVSIRKGVHYLLQAFHELKLPNAELSLIGPISGEIRPFLEKYASPGIRIRGSVPQAELHKEYAGGSVFCLTSIEDGFGMVLPQAMACGLPAICTENTAAHDVVRHGVDGFVIPIRDVEKLKEHILELYLDRGKAREMGRSARLRIETACTWDVYGDRLVYEYGRIAGSSSLPAQAAAGKLAQAVEA